MSADFTTISVHKSRILSKQAEDEQSFAIELPIIRDRPCYGLGDWSLLLNANSIIRGVEVLWFREVHCERTHRTYCQIEGHIRSLFINGLVLSHSLVHHFPD
uniref:Uncharacterized protein n=1 Tax=Meloidogyne incognita TaxID=6306 RepID=A0A914L6Q4_MELIC